MKKLLSLVVVFALAITMLNTSAFVVDTKAVSSKEDTEKIASAIEKSVNEYYKTHKMDKNGNINVKDEYYKNTKSIKKAKSNNSATGSYVAPYTSVKSQNPFGACWMFGGIGAAESNLLKKAGYKSGKAKRDPIDLSEAQGICTIYNADVDENNNRIERSDNDIRIISYGWDDYKGFRGGAWPIDSAISMSAEKGSALEEDNPFLSSIFHPEHYGDAYDQMTDEQKETHKKSKASEMLAKAREQYNLNRFHLKSVEQLPEIFVENGKYNDEFNYNIVDENRDIWKDKIETNGAIYAMFYQNHEAKHYHCWGKNDDAYAGVDKKPNYWYYTPRTGGDQNHVVAIVGYDDNYSKYNFAERYIDPTTNKPNNFDTKIAHKEWIKEENGKPLMTGKDGNLQFVAGTENGDGCAEYIVPNEDGALIIKQSYSTKDKEGKKKFNDGIEYMSYCETSFQEPISLVVEESLYQINNHKKIYDTTLTHSSLMGHPIEGLNKDAEASEVYTVDTDTEIEQVGYWTGKNNTNTKIEIRTNLSDPSDPKSGNVLYSSNTLNDEYKGYHTVKIPNKIVLNGSTTISVIISQNCGGKSALMLESDTKDVFGMGYDFKCIAGDTFINNNNNNWIDPTELSLSGVKVGNSTVKLFGNAVTWKNVPDSEEYYWNTETKENVDDVFGIYSLPYITDREGLVVKLPNNITGISVNGETEGVAAYRDDMAIIYESSLNKYLNKISFTCDGGTSYLEVRNVGGDTIYDVDDYIKGDERAYPEKDGEVFAGWYEDSAFTTPISSEKVSGQAYAKFVDEKVLDTKFQWRENDCGAVRFVSSLDNTDYLSAGFIISGVYGDRTITTQEKSISKVYSSIKADGESINPSDAFSVESQFFTTYTVRGMDKDTKSSWDVKAFYVTPDGTKVIGEKGCNYYMP